MTTREEVMEALEAVRHEQYNQSLIELGLLRDVMVKDEAAALTLIATTEDEAVQQVWKSRISEVLAAHGLAVHIRVRLISDYERNALQAKLEQRGDAAPQQDGKPGPQPQPHFRPGDQATLLDPGSGVTFIAVASGKGGVGKSTVTVNLAAALARQGKRVGVMDCDIYGFSVPDMMGIEEKPQLVEEKIQPVERFGVKVISMGFFVEDNAPIIWRGPMLGKMLRNFFVEVNWGELDYLLLDLPPGTGDIALDVHQMIPQCKEIIVTTPHATAAFVAARAGAMAVRTDHEILGVVENMAYYTCSECGHKDYVFGRGGGGKLAEELHTELLAQIPLGAPDNHPSEPEFSPSVYKADSKTGALYLELAARVIAQCGR